MTVNYVVTFEFETRPPLTHRGQATAITTGTCMARAVREAQDALGPRGWTSVVCVLLDRVQDVGESLDAASGASDGLLDES